MFTGLVLSVTEDKEDHYLVEIQVAVSFRGGLFGKVTLEQYGGGMCGYPFEAGYSYFVYAHWTAGAWFSAYLCGRTEPLERAGEEIAHALALPRRDAAVIEGQITMESSGKPIAGATVSLRGTCYDAQTGADGRYRLEAPPGRYDIDVDAAGLGVMYEPDPVDLVSPAMCADRDATMAINGRIRGQVIGADGQPVPDVAVYAEPEGNWPPRQYGVTDARGGYEIGRIPPGRFRVGVSTREAGGPSPWSPYPATFYPGVRAAEHAAMLYMPRAGTVDHVDFPLPPALTVHTVHGTVRGRSGHPEPRALVMLSDDRSNRGIVVDAAGEYRAEVVAGNKVSLRACRLELPLNGCVTTREFRVTRDLRRDLRLR